MWDELIKSLGDVSSPEEAWGAIPEAEEDEIKLEAGGVPWRVYRDGDRLCAVNDRTGTPKSIKRTSFFKYFTRKVRD